MTPTDSITQVARLEGNDVLLAVYSFLKGLQGNVFVCASDTWFSKCTVKILSEASCVGNY